MPPSNQTTFPTGAVINRGQGSQVVLQGGVNPVLSNPGGSYNPGSALRYNPNNPFNVNANGAPLPGTGNFGGSAMPNAITGNNNVGYPGGNPLGVYTQPTGNAGGQVTPQNTQPAPIPSQNQGVGYPGAGTAGIPGGGAPQSSPGAGGATGTGAGSAYTPPLGGGSGILGYGNLSDAQRAALDYASGSNFKTPQSEGDVYTKLSSQLDSQIQKITDAYNSVIAGDQQIAQNAQIEQRVSSALTGQGGSGNASAASLETARNSNVQIGKDQAAKAQALTSIYQQIQSNSIAYAQYQQTQANTDATTAANTLAAIAQAGMKYVAGIAATGVDPNTLMTNDPQTWSQLMQQTGMSSYALTNYMVSQLPAAYQPQVNTTYSVAPDGTTIANVTISKYDPSTGKISATTSQSSIPVNFQQFNKANMITLPNGSQGYINNQGQVIDLSTNQPYMPVTSVPQGGVLLNPTTGGVVGSGEPRQTVVPLTSGVVQSGGAAGNGQTGQSGGQRTANPLGNPTGSSSASLGSFQNGLESTGNPSWGSISSLPGVSSKQLSLIQTEYGTPLEAYNQGIQWILNVGKSSSSGGMSSGTGVRTANNNVIAAIGSGILQSYGLTQQDANTISEVDTGLSSSLTTMIGRQATVNQYIQKSQTQAQILNQAMKNYGDNGASPLVNSVVQEFQKNIYSDPSFNSFQVALGTFLKDYARISDNATGSGAATTDSSNASAAEKLSTLMSQGSLQSALATMWDEMNAQVSSLNTSVTGLQQSLSNVIQNYAATKNGGSFSSSMGNSGSSTAIAPIQGSANTTQMVGPDGQAYNVPNDKVNAFISAGGKKQ